MKVLLAFLVATLLCLTASSASAQCPGGRCGGNINVQPGQVEVRLGWSPLRRLFGGGSVLVVKQQRPRVQLIPTQLPQ